MTNQKFIKATLLLVVTLFVIQFASAEEKGANWDKQCQDNLCTMNVYSYDKYWLNDEQSWETIDENWQDCSTDVKEQYCTPEYYYEATATEDGEIIANKKGDEIVYSLKLSNFLDESLNFDPQLKNNVIAYNDIIDNVDLRYQYLPKKLKEEIVINSPLDNLPEEDFDITFTKSGGASFEIEESTICDFNNYCEVIPSQVKADEIVITIPISFLNNPKIEYPVIIDPTITLNDSSISWNRYIANRTNATSGAEVQYVRSSNPASGMVITSPTAVIFGLNESDVAVIEWNMSQIPDSSDIRNVTLQAFFFCSGIGCGTPTYRVNVTNMEKTHGGYVDSNGTCASADNGNCLFYTDARNGTVYNSSYFSGNNILINLTFDSQIRTDMQNSLSSDLFGLGFVGYNTTFSGIQIGSKDNSNVTRRPMLTIIYGANETDSDNAIDLGISDSLPGNPRDISQQIYLVNQNGQHYLGTFDRATIFGNQTWAFNYISGLETFINMPSLFRTLNTWENSSLTSSEIRNQVGLFINATKY